MEKDIKESITNISKSFPKEKEIEVKDQKAKEKPKKKKETKHSQ